MSKDRDDMIYCRIQDCEFAGHIRFRASEYFNADHQDVTTLLSGDVIKIFPIIPEPEGSPIILVVDKVIEGWVYPVRVNVNIPVDFSMENVALYKEDGSIGG